MFVRDLVAVLFPGCGRPAKRAQHAHGVILHRAADECAGGQVSAFGSPGDETEGKEVLVRGEDAGRVRAAEALPGLGVGYVTLDQVDEVAAGAGGAFQIKVCKSELNPHVRVRDENKIAAEILLVDVIVEVGRLHRAIGVRLGDFAASALKCTSDTWPRRRGATTTAAASVITKLIL